MFNKDSGLGKPEKEQEAICKYTEMCNPNVQVKGGSPAGKDGDIHPTIKGYKALGEAGRRSVRSQPRQMID